MLEKGPVVGNGGRPPQEEVTPALLSQPGSGCCLSILRQVEPHGRLAVPVTEPEAEDPAAAPAPRPARNCNQQNNKSSPASSCYRFPWYKDSHWGQFPGPPTWGPCTWTRGEIHNSGLSDGLPPGSVDKSHLGSLQSSQRSFQTWKGMSRAPDGREASTAHGTGSLPSSQEPLPGARAPAHPEVKTAQPVAAFLQPLCLRPTGPERMEKGDGLWQQR
ncbi:uncharacterized protein LOC123927275 [Meles meles]|uniref:uncharacterized protein LOC123927275 n=1 Tax=Meles meles TaxID=9662 RepID=UPI001E69876F|nr:uncharacterized protein LOC123927275 [Meles meles]XP_045837797.1 uncharacterized protein LOC123927275 [Meles meles]